MGQRNRYDGPGVRHHVMNRGVGKRLMFAGRRDRRQFLCEIARAFRREQLHIEAWSILGTHFHLLLRTDEGTLSEAMRRIQNGYSRWFNRRNRRDGPLPRARFRSRPVRSEAQLFATVPYIDFNPVQAGLCPHPGAYEGGSARHYLAEDFPRWMSPDRILSRLKLRAGGEMTAGAAYAAIFGRPASPYEMDLMEHRFRVAPAAEDDLDYILEAPSERALAWIEKKARHADGTAPACALLSCRAIEASVEEAARGGPDLTVRLSRKTCEGWRFLLFGLQNAMAGQSGAALARRHRVAPSTASRYVSLHRELLAGDAQYAEACRLVTVAALERTYRRCRVRGGGAWGPGGEGGESRRISPHSVWGA